MNDGKIFEQTFRESAIEDGYWFYRIPDMFAINPKFAGKSMADCILFDNNNNKLFILELKSTKSKSISIQTKENGTEMIKQHQIKSLIKNNLSDNVEGCFILNFRKENNECTYMINIDNFIRFQDNENKSSINENDVIKYGGIICKQELKRVKYRYYIKDMLDRGE